MTANLLATAVLLIGCYTGSGSGNTDETTSADTAIEDSANETGGAENLVIEIENFIDGKSLTFEIPPDWSYTENERSITAASFPPPHQGKAEAMPEGTIVRVLSYHPTEIEYFLEQQISVASGIWTKAHRSGIGTTMITYINQTNGIALVGYRTSHGEIDDTDELVIETILASISVQPGDTP